MLQFQNQRQQQLLIWCKLICRCTVSCIFVLLTQFALSLVPRFFSASSLLIQLTLSGLVLLLVVGSGRWCRRLVGVYASAPAFVVFNILFIWGVYIFIVRQAIPRLTDVVFNGEVAMLFIGLFSIASRDPGFVTNGSSHLDEDIETEAFGVEAHNEKLETSTSGTCRACLKGGSVMLKRVRYCKSCKAYVNGFDHHCPAFGNCIGKNNYVLFMVLLVGFLTTEASYVVCSSQFARGSQILGGSRFGMNLTGSLVVSTMLFSLLQMLWQVVFVTWHIYCICFHIRTDEWINWKKYPEFQLIVPSQPVVPSQPGENFTKMMFRNPYDKGVLQNVVEFLALEV